MSVVQTIDLFSLNLWPVVCASGGLKFDSKFLLFLSSQFLLFLVVVIFRFTHCASFWIDLFYFFDCYYSIIIFSSIVIRHFFRCWFTLSLLSLEKWCRQRIEHERRPLTSHVTKYRINETIQNAIILWKWSLLSFSVVMWCEKKFRYMKISHGMRVNRSRNYDSR